MQRVFFHYSDLEEWRCGMWRIVRGEARKSNIARAAALMRDPEAFKAAMRRALDEWPNSVRQNLTAEDTNRLAWLGHAGCQIGVGSPEENTRCGWHTLSLPEQAAADAAAQCVLNEWIAANMDDLPLLALMGAKC